MTEATESAMAEQGDTGLAMPMQSLFDARGAGMEEIGNDDLTVPYLSIAQKMSAICDMGQAEFNPEAKPGMLYNTVTGELYDGDEGLLVVPCHFRAVLVEHELKGNGKLGAFVAEHPASSKLIDETTRDGKFDTLPSGNVLIRKARHYLLLAHEQEPVVFTMKSTSLKVSRRWVTQLTGRKMEGPDGKSFTPPMFTSVWRLSTVTQQNDDGTWHNPKLEMVADVADEGLFGACRDFAAMVNGGEVKEAGDED